MGAKKILVIGNGAREHAICGALDRSNQEVEIFVVGKAINPGMKSLAEDYLVGDICDKELVVDFAKKCEVDFVVVGPEAPIACGMVDALENAGISCCSPTASFGQLESSKGFTRELLEKYGIEGNPKFKVFTSEEGLREFFEILGDDYVVKADGLKGGKGVKVSGDHLHGMEEGIEYALECLEDGGQVVVEEKLIGQEFSLMSFADGKSTIEMPVIQDHKRAYEGDKGPNTGGMGTYSCGGSMPFLKETDVEQAAEITKKVMQAMNEECDTNVHNGFRGVMYGGFIAVKDGVRLIEYNARFGDPEAMNVLTLLESDFVEICEAIIAGNLGEIDVKFSKKATVCKYAVPDGYPENPCKGEKIEVTAGSDNVKVFYSSVDEKEDGLYLSGSRAVAFVGVADSLAEAEKLAEKAVSAVKGPVFHRKDIGTEEVIATKVAMMEKIRG